MNAARHGRRRSTLTPRGWLVLAASVGSIGVSFASVWATVPDPGPSAEAGVQRRTMTPEEIRAYWTPERVKAATPAEMPVAPAECSDWRWFLHARCW